MSVRFSLDGAKRLLNRLAIALRAALAAFRVSWRGVALPATPLGERRFWVVTDGAAQARKAYEAVQHGEYPAEIYDHGQNRGCYSKHCL